MSNETTTNDAPAEPLPWPDDAVMVVAAYAGAERRERMEGVYPCKCRDCGQALHADTYTVRVAENHPARHGRPVLFFCLGCHDKYDNTRLDCLHRHNVPGGKKADAALANKGTN